MVLLLAVRHVPSALEGSPPRGVHGGRLPLETFFHVSSSASNPVNPSAFEGLYLSIQALPPRKTSIGHQTQFR